MLLHLVSDEKIINRTIDLFECAFPGNNLFVVVTGRSKFRHVRIDDCVLSRADFLVKYKKYEITSVVIHSLNERKMNLLNKLPLENIPVYWIIWGADLYNKLLGPKGYELFDKEGAYYKERRLKRYLCRPISWVQDKYRVLKTIRFIKNKVDYLVTDTTENDYDVFLHYFPEMKNKPWRDFFYYPIDEILGERLIEAQVKGDNIMIGNSASFTNNHEYAMRLLSQLNINERKVIVPLSYSGKQEYLSIVIRKGKKLFGDNFQPLLEFIPLTEYNELLTSVNISIYANWRQEGIGNILISLYLGAKVFVSNRNPILAWAHGHGLVIFELERITQEELDTCLAPKARLSNRNILLGLYNKKRLFELMKKVFAV